MGIAAIITDIGARAENHELFPFDPATKVGVVADGTIRWVEPGATETLGLPCALEVSAWETILAANPPHREQVVMTSISFGLEVNMQTALAYISSFVFPR